MAVSIKSLLSDVGSEAITRLYTRVRCSRKVLLLWLYYRCRLETKPRLLALMLEFDFDQRLIVSSARLTPLEEWHYQRVGPHCWSG